MKLQVIGGIAAVLMLCIGIAIPVLNPVVPATITPRQHVQAAQPAPQPVKEDTTQDERNLWVAGVVGVWLDYCVDGDTVPKQVAAVRSTILYYSQLYGSDAVKASYAKQYTKGYFEMGKTWCPHAESLIRQLMR